MPGPPGREGIPGARGPKGMTGSPGLDGRDGVPGEPGLDGVPGRAGADGIPGKDGKDGLPGTDGQHGQNGKDGKLKAHKHNCALLICYNFLSYAGREGLTGPQGPSGIIGERGKSFKIIILSSLQFLFNYKIYRTIHLRFNGAEGSDGKTRNQWNTWHPWHKCMESKSERFIYERMFDSTIDTRFGFRITLKVILFLLNMGFSKYLSGRTTSAAHCGA